jgi:hypothetical protein
MTMNKDNYKYTEELKDVLEAKKEYDTKGKAALAKLISKYFELNPSVLFLFWQQYTPYFNDGDECKFRLGDIISFELKNELIEEREEESEASGLVKFPRDKEGNKILPTVEYMLDNVNGEEVDFDPMSELLEKAVNPCSSEDYADFFMVKSDYGSSFYKQMRSIQHVLQEVVGDHVNVVVGRDLKIHTTEYEHS